MSFLKAALDLASRGFHVFPLVAGSKLPAIEDFPHAATRDPEKIKSWWTDPLLELEQPYNVGISTSRYGDDRALLVVDVDNKGTLRGDDTIETLGLLGQDLPQTLEQTTPTGGRHLLYVVVEPVKQGAGVLGSGVDIRSRGGYIVGAGSQVEAGSYSAESAVPPSCAPQWLVERCGLDRRIAPKSGGESETFAASRTVPSAGARAAAYLEREAPLAREGDAGDQTTFAVAARVKDFGVNEEDCLRLLDTLWNPRCEPPWNLDELEKKVANAYRYGRDPVGVAAPETQFKPLTPEIEPATKEHPFKELNREFAFVVAGGGAHILWETTDAKGVFKLEHLGVNAFHQKLASRMMQLGNGKSQPLSELWMKTPERRSYDGIVFMPGKKAPERFYNLWRGFAYEPLEGRAHEYIGPWRRSLDMFLEHALENVCNGDPNLFLWLIGYFAHLIQKPWEKPLVAIVFKGSKGTGKNALIDRVGALLGHHYLLTSNRRYLVSNFNGHLENLLLFALDEAFWSGDKQAEGTLKDLITGKTHVVEHKGKEPYAVDNCTRVVIIGNEEWLVPATQDERRFAVFNVGDGRKQDRGYFRAMREGMERGGYRLLLRYLLDYDITGIDVDAAPLTAGLLDQKLSSLEPFHQWWFACLSEGRIINGEFSTEWPSSIDVDSFWGAFTRNCRERNIRSRTEDRRGLGRMLTRVVSGVEKTTRREGGIVVNAYKLPSLDEARRSFEKFIGHEVKWE